MVKLFVILGSMLGCFSVGLGAFGAHGLKSKVADGSLPERMLEVWATAAQYQMYHALALIAAAWLVQQTESQWAVVGGWALFVGTLLFSGSLYALVLSQVKVLGAITPIGGLSLMLGWIGLAVAAITKWQ